jgi:hypothetical protein
MIALLWILTLTAATRVPLVDEVYTIPADQWRYVELGLKQQPALVLAHYDAPEKSSVSLALMRREDMENLRQGLPHGAIKVTGPGHAATLQARVTPGDYVLVVGNESDSHAATVSLRVWLDFSSGPNVTVLSHERQLAVILASLAVFFGIVGYAASKLWNATKPGMRM